MIRVQAWKALVVLLLLLSGLACQESVVIPPGDGLEDWTVETHSNAADPNYDVVFNQNQVNRIDIEITEAQWQMMQDDLADLASSGGRPGSFSDKTPVYGKCQLYFNGKQWYNVGIRYKGNSSLYSSYQQGIGKLPLRLEFDHFEDEDPTILDQRFYGFKELSLSNNYNDRSLMREKTGADLFREFGVPAAHTAFYQVYVNSGSGPVYFGLYTMVEVIFDTFLDSQFGSNSGNCYKPEGEGARFGATGFSLSDFEKKTNEDAADWSDIQEMYNALHANTRTTDVEQWKAGLEAVFDVDGFLKYLAVNGIIQNWDTYGVMTHNYYLYHDPADDLIKWIVWDHNEAFMDDGGPRAPLSLELNEVGNNWPLISYLIDVPEYRAIYDAYIAEFVATAFDPAKMDLQYSSQDALIAFSATSEIANYTFLTAPAAYAQAVALLKAHCASRNIAAAAYLGSD